VPVGATQGAAQVNVKLVAVIVAGAIALLKTTAIAELLGTPVVGPGVVVAGTVVTTRGRVASEVAAVVNVQVKAFAILAPVARLAAPPIVTVYSVSVASALPDVNVNVAIVFVASSVTVPVALVQGVAHVTVILAAPVIGATGSLNVAVMTGLSVGTSVAPPSGVSAITAGASAATPFVPRI
jgi:hypothetical protein